MEVILDGALLPLAINQVNLSSLQDYNVVCSKHIPKDIFKRIFYVNKTITKPFKTTIISHFCPRRWAFGTGFSPSEFLLNVVQQRKTLLRRSCFCVFLITNSLNHNIKPNRNVPLECQTHLISWPFRSFKSNAPFHSHYVTLFWSKGWWYHDKGLCRVSDVFSFGNLLKK